MSGVAFDEEGIAYWQDDSGNNFPITTDEDGDYVIHDGDGEAYVLDDTVVDAALESYIDPADYVTRGEFYQGVTDMFAPQPDPAELAAGPPRSRRPKQPPSSAPRRTRTGPPPWPRTSTRPSIASASR